MIIFFSGGSAVAETKLKRPQVMLSYYNNTNSKDNGPDARLRDLIAARIAWKAGNKKGIPACEFKKKPGPKKGSKQKKRKKKKPRG